MIPFCGKSERLEEVIEHEDFQAICRFFVKCASLAWSVQDIIVCIIISDLTPSMAAASSAANDARVRHGAWVGTEVRGPDIIGMAELPSSTP